MPQMAPINWIFLYIFFLLIYYIINSMTYFIYMSKNKTKKINKIYSPKIAWKW